MRRGEYIETRRGQSAALTHRRLRRFHFSIDQAPQSKNIKPGDAVAFQQTLLTALEHQRRRSFRGPVFLQIRFYNQSKTPPAIQTLPKNYLDLLETPRRDAGIARRHLLYMKDRQVKGLVVGYNLTSPGPNGTPSIEVDAEPFRDFLADIALVERIKMNTFSADTGSRASWHDQHEFRNGPFRDEEGWGAAGFARFAEFTQHEASWIRSLGRETYEALKALKRSELQEGHLMLTDLFICRSLLWHYGASAARTVFRPLRQMLASPFVLDLHHAPRIEGDTARFKADIRAAIEGYKNDHPFFFPLSTLLKVTILMVPPEGGGKDLDNLAKNILPAVHEILQPPSDLTWAMNLDTIQDERVKAQLEAHRARLPKEPKHSIVEYRAFELPRYSDDPKEGLVRLAIGGGVMAPDFRTEIDRFLEWWQESID